MPATDAEQNVIEEFVDARDAEQVDGWHRVDPDDDLLTRGDEALAQWANDDETIHVIVGVFRSDDRDDSYRARAVGTEDANFGRATIATSAESLVDALDEAHEWMRARAANLTLGNFRMVMPGGVILPILDLMQRFGGGTAVFEVREDGIDLHSRRFDALVEVEVAPADMEEWEFRQAGVFTVPMGELWAAVEGFNFGTTLVLETDVRNEPRAQLGITGGAQLDMSNAAGAPSRDFPLPMPPDAQFVATGAAFEAVERATRDSNGDLLIDAGLAAFGVHEGVALLVMEDGEAVDALRARLDTTSVEGDLMVGIDPDKLQNLRIAVPRPSSTDLTFSLKREAPMLVEYQIDGADTDLVVAVEPESAIEDIELSVPAAEIEAPEPEEPAAPDQQPTAADTDTDMPEPDLSRSEIETIVEQATLGVTAAAQVIGGDLREITMEPDSGAPVAFADDSQQVTVVAEDGTRETIRRAVDRWAEFVDLSSIAAPDRREVDRRRDALAEQFGLDLDPLPAEPGPPEPEPEQPTVDGFTTDDLERLLSRVVDGVEPSVEFNQGIDEVAIRFDPLPAGRRGVSFEDEIGDKVVSRQLAGTLDAVEEAIQFWDAAVDPADVDVEGINQRREEAEDAFDLPIDLPRFGGEADGDTGVEPTPAGRTPAAAREEREPGDIWQRVRATALNQDIPLADRETRVGELLEDRLQDEYPTAFQDIAVGLDFQQGAGQGQGVEDVLLIELGGELSDSGEQRFVQFATINILDAKGSIRDPEAVWTDFLDVAAMFDPEDERFGDVTDKLQTVASTSAFRIEDGLVNLDDIFIPPDTVGEIVRRNRDLYTLKILGHMKDESKAWHAAQRVQECASGVQAICDLIEREIAGGTPRGYSEWYLKNAYSIFLQGGEFDPALFVREWHDVFRPGEEERKARDRRGEVDLDTLGRPGAQSSAGGRDTGASETGTEPEPSSRQTGPPEDSGGDSGPSMGDIRSEFDERL